MASKKTTKKNKKPRNKGMAPALIIFAVGLLMFLSMFIAGVVMQSYNEDREDEYLSKEKVKVTEIRDEANDRRVDPIGKVAIVIDDMGYSMDKLQGLIDIGTKINIAVLPHLKYSRGVATKAHKNGMEVLLHIPMEPKDLAGNDPGDGAILLSMTPEEVRGAIARDLESVPYVSGVNNHMGSRYTEYEAGMKVVMEVMKERGYYFLDSRTSGASVVESVATSAGIRTGTRNIFLDNERDVAAIEAQMEKLVEIARKNGSAIGIGHPYSETLAALKNVLPRMAEEGVEFIQLSELMK